MADNFDAVDIMYDIVSPFGVTCYKDKAPDESRAGQLGEHIVINSPSGNRSGFGTNDLTVNVNIHIPKVAGGYINRTRMKTVRTGVKSLIEAAGSIEGYYSYIERGFTALLENTKPGYDVFVMRYLLTLNN